MEAFHSVTGRPGSSSVHPWGPSLRQLGQKTQPPGAGPRRAPNAQCVTAPRRAATKPGLARCESSNGKTPGLVPTRGGKGGAGTLRLEAAAPLAAPSSHGASWWRTPRAWPWPSWQWPVGCQGGPRLALSCFIACKPCLAGAKGQVGAVDLLRNCYFFPRAALSLDLEVQNCNSKMCKAGYSVLCCQG